MAAHQHSLTCVAVPCASAIYVMNAEHAFSALCHPKFYVDSVTPLTNSKKPYCSWVVHYKYKDHNSSYHQDFAATNEFALINTHTPTNVFAHKKSVSHAPPEYLIEYGVRCTCRKPFFEEVMTTLVNESAAFGGATQIQIPPQEITSPGIDLSGLTLQSGLDLLIKDEYCAGISITGTEFGTKHHPAPASGYDNQQDSTTTLQQQPSMATNRVSTSEKQH